MTRKEDTLGQVMSSPVITVSASDILGAAAKTMVKHDIGAVVVLEMGNYVGIVTECDETGNRRD